MGQHKFKQAGEVIGKFDPETGIAFANYRHFNIYEGQAIPNFIVRGKRVPRVNPRKRALRDAKPRGEAL